MCALSASLAMTVNSQEFQNGEGHFLLALPRQLVSPSPPPLYHVVQRSPSPVYMMAHHQLSRSSLCILVSSVTHPALLVAGLCFGLCSSLVACVCCLDSPTNQPEEERQVPRSPISYHLVHPLCASHRLDSTPFPIKRLESFLPRTRTRRKLLGYFIDTRPRLRRQQAVGRP